MAHGRETGASKMRGRGAGTHRNGPKGHYWKTRHPYLPVERERPGRAYRHVVRRRDIALFLELVPHARKLRIGLQSIVLAQGVDGLDGWYEYSGVIGLCAWPQQQYEELCDSYVEEHRELFDRLGVIRNDDGCWYQSQFTVTQARAYMLLHIFLHELGHHQDRMTTRSRQYSSRGEPYAEAYAHEAANQIWDDYEQSFGLI